LWCLLPQSSETLVEYLYVGHLSSEEKTLLSQMTKNMVKFGQILLTNKDQKQKNIVAIKTLYDE